MKLNPKVWINKKDQPAAYLTKIMVVTSCIKCPHVEIPITELDLGTGIRCGVSTSDIENPSSRPSWCPLSEAMPVHDPLIVWEGEVRRED